MDTCGSIGHADFDEYMSFLILVHRRHVDTHGSIGHADFDVVTQILIWTCDTRHMDIKFFLPCDT